MHLRGERLERALASPRYRDGKFHNTAPVGLGPQGSQRAGERGEPDKIEGGSSGVIKEFLFGRKKRKPPAEIPVHSPLERWAKPEDGLRVTWLGHSTMLLEMSGVRVLTDPVFGEHLGPVSFVGPKRFHATPATIAQLPKLDAILVSHDHYDHLCRRSIEELAALRVPIVTSLGVGAHLEKFGVETIHELDWHESIVVGPVKFTATPSQHFSGRLGGGRNTTLWSSWVIETERHRVFFSGDTGLTPEFEAVGKQYGPFELVMLEIGAWHPAWGTIHLGPENALKAFDMLGGGTLMPVHWGTFDLGLHPWAEPAETLMALAGSRRVVTPMLGDVFHPARYEGRPWWRSVSAAERTEDEGAPVPAR